MQTDAPSSTYVLDTTSNQHKLQHAVELITYEYNTNEDLTAFTILDEEDFFKILSPPQHASPSDTPSP